MNFDLDYLEKLAKLVDENNLSEITLEDENIMVSLKRSSEKSFPAANFDTNIQNNNQAQITTSDTSVIEETSNKKHKGRPITSPMAGTFYCSPSPDEEPFVKTGDNVSIGQVVCIIEAMKLMNEIESDLSGKVTDICVKNGDNVEVGQILMYIE